MENSKEPCSKRIKEALKIRELKQSDLVKATGIGKSAISQYISGKYVPKQSATYKIAKALNVSEVWLMGYDVPMQRIEEFETAMRTNEEQFFSLFNKLDSADKKETIDFMEYKLAKDKYKVKEGLRNA